MDAQLIHNWYFVECTMPNACQEFTKGFINRIQSNFPHTLFAKNGSKLFVSGDSSLDFCLYCFEIIDPGSFVNL